MNEVEANELVIVDLGSRSAKQVKMLRKGKGKLVREVEDCVAELKAAGAINTAAQPVVVVVAEKAVSFAKPLMIVPGFPPFPT